MHHFYRITPTIDSISINPEKVVQSLQKRVKAGKGYGPDCINSTDLSIIGNSASTGLSVIIQNSISQNKYPSQWKTSRVRSVFKKGSKLLPENYRPISLLSIPSKIYEDLICKEIDKHVYTHDLSSKHHWGFKKKHSTELLMLKLTERWKQELDSGNVVGVLFIDLKKTFDSVCHNTLALKMQANGISGNLCKLITDYLTDRKQYSEINGINSEKKPIKYGVPQGFLLGPRLFGFQVNDLPDSVESSEVEMFAEDTEAYCVGKTVDEVSCILQKLVNEVSKWCTNNSLSIHPDKTKIMIISKTNFTGPLQPISLNGNIIKYVSSSKCLGMIVDTKLNWKSQIDNVSSDLSSKLKKLRRIKSLPPSTLETIYFKGILPSALYGIAVWGSCAPETLQNLENVHIRAARLIHKIHPSISKSDVLQIANWKSVGYMYKRRVVWLTHQALYDKELPADIQDIITIQSTTRNMRDNLKLALQRPKTEYGRKTFKHRAAIIWNTLPESLKGMEN